MDSAAFAYLAPFSNESDLLGIVDIWRRNPLLRDIQSHYKKMQDIEINTPSQVAVFWALFSLDELADVIYRNTVCDLFPTSRFSFENVAIARELTRYGLRDCDEGGWAMDYENADFNDLLARLEEPTNADEE